MKMKRIVLRIGLAGVILAVAGVLVLSTSPVARLVTRKALPYLNEQLNGTLTVERAGGSILNRLVLTGITLRDSTGVTVLGADRAEIRYSLLALLRGRFRFGPVHLRQPTIRLVQDAPGAPYGLVQIFAREREDSGDASGRVDLRLQGLVIEDGVVEATVPRTTLTAPDDRQGPGLDTIRVAQLNLDVPELYLRRSADAPRAAGVRIAGASARVVEPEILLEALAGEISVRGDSIAASLLRLDFPQTALTGRGWMAMRPGEARPTFDGTLRILRLNTEDLAPLSRWVRSPWVVRGAVQATSRVPGVTDVRLNEFEIRAAGGVASLSGAMTLHPDGSWAQHDLRVAMDGVSAQRLADAYDVPGLGGRVTGTITADGPREALDLAVDLALVQVNLSPAARSRLEGSGQVVAIPGAPAVRRFEIRAARLDLRSARAVAPRLPLVGMLDLTGRLTGSPRDLVFDGALRYEEQELPASTARAAVHVVRGTPTVIAAALTLDSLRLEGFRRSFPGRELEGAVGGEVRASGTRDSLAVDSRLGGAAGSLVVSGVARMPPGVIAVEGLVGELRGLNFQAVDPALPVSNISAAVTAALAVRDDTVRSAEIRLSLDSSIAGLATIDTAALSARLADGVVTLDSLHVRATGLEADAGGSFGWADTPGTLALRLKVDSLDQVRTFVTTWSQPADTTLLPRRGSLLVTGTVQGSRSRFRADLTMDAEDLATGKGRFAAAALTGSFSVPDRELRVEATVDSLAAGGITVSSIALGVAGTLDSLAWRTHTVLDQQTEVTAAGTAGFGVRREVVVDSLGVRRAATDWRLEQGGRIGWSPDGWVLDRVSLRRIGGDGRIAVDGRVSAPDSLRLAGVVERLSLLELAIEPEEDSALSGTIDADFELAGAVRRPTGHGRLALTAAALGDHPIPDVRAEARIEGGMVRGEVAMSLGDDRPLTLRGRFPLGDGDSTLDVELTADSLSLALVDPLVPNVSDVAGWLDARVTIGGSLDAPTLEGTAALTGGAATLGELGVRYDSIGGRFTMRGERLAVEELRLVSGDDSARVGGSVTFEGLARPVLDLTLDAWRFPVMDNPDLLRGAASGHLTITGPLIGATLRGRGDLTQGVAFPDQFIQKQVIDLSDSLYAQFVDTTVLRREKVGAGPFQIFVDSLKIDSLEVDLGPNFWVRTPDANIQLGGTLLLSKRGDRYLVDGQVNALRGLYRLRLAAGLTREFEVERGSVRYFGTEDLNAELDIDAHHELRSARGENVVVSVHIGGTIRKPQLRLSSNVRPPLSETEIVSYLLFGAPSVHAFVGDGSGERRSVFQQSAGRFVGALSGQVETALVEGLGLPVDMLRIEPGDVQSGLSGTELLIGKQVNILGRSSFLTASPRLCPRERLVSLERIGVSLETRLGARWGIAGSVDPTRGCETSVASSTAPYELGVDLFWEKR